MGGCNMGFTRIFSDKSIQKFLNFSRLWILNMKSTSDTDNLNEQYYYVGSYLYDVLGQRYEKFSNGEPIITETWNNLTGRRFRTIRRVFGVKADNDSLEADKQEERVNSITQLIQQLYLTTDHKIVHLFRKNGNCVCEILTRLDDETDLDFSYMGKPYYYSGNPLEDLPLSDLGKKNTGIVKSIFDLHFELIKKAEDAHMYFFPRALGNSGQIINVSLIISPEELDDGDIGIVQFGVESASAGLIEDTVEYFNKIAENEARKSAKAAIMSRNMSHNLGSHVMAYLKNDLRNIPSIFGSNVLEELFPNSFGNDVPAIESIKNSVELPFLVGLGGFIGYLQERQDYIATIATSYIPSFSPVNFKDAIYDELNPDLKYIRHQQEGGIYRNKPQNILLSYIAKSEKLSRILAAEGDAHDIILSFKCPNTPKFTGEESDSPSLAAMRKLNFALPGGIVGRQAIFSIIENIIRNAAKHNNIDGNLELVFEAIDGRMLKENPEYYAESISDVELRKRYCSSRDIEDLTILSITDNLPCTEKTISKLKAALGKGYYGPEGQNHKGINEILISATWLRGVENESDLISKGFAPAVAIERSVSGKQSLRYFVCLKKTYEFALVYEDLDSKADFCSHFDFKEGSYITLSEEDIKVSDACFEYIIAENQKVYSAIRPFVSNRCFDFSRIVKVGMIRDIDVYSAYTGIDIDSSEPVYILDDKVVDIEFPDKIKKLDTGKMILPEDTIGKALSLCGLLGNNNVPSNTYAAILASGARYLYRSHHFGDIDFSAYWLDRAKTSESISSALSSVSQLSSRAPYSIDAITGDNSSDRLVRREPLNKRWYFSHLFALSAKVSVFDERLFQIIHSLDESKMTHGTYLATRYYRDCEQGNWPVLNERQSDDAINQLLNDLGVFKVPSRRRFRQLYALFFESGGDASIRNELHSFLGEFVFKFNEQIQACNYLTAAYHEKGVNVFTIIPTGNASCFVVGNTGYQYLTKYDSLTNKLVPDYRFDFSPFVKIMWQEDKEDFECETLLPFEKCQYMSIHQGLIDKMYEAFNLKNSELDEEKSSLLKKKLLRSFYNCFMVSPLLDEKAFLERMIIHSGRGNITQSDMPERLPFIQYSAIEHAVLDCKYALVELLDCSKAK